MGLKGNFFTLDALLASSIMIGAIILLSNQVSEDPFVIDISHISQDTLDVLSTIKVGEVNNSVIQSLVDEGNITAGDMNRSMLEMIGVFWAEGHNDIAQNLTQSVLGNIVPDEYNYGLWAEDTRLLMVNSTGSRNLVAYRKFISGIQQGEIVRGFLSKIVFNDISSKRTNSFLYFGGYVGEGNITKVFTLPSNVTFRNATLELNPGSDFNLTINGFDAGKYVKGSGGGGYMRADRWSLASKLAFFKDGENEIRIVFNGTKNTYIGGGFLQLTYETPYKSQIETTYINGTGIKHFWIPGISGIINLYDSFYIPGTLNEMDVHLEYFSNYTSFLSLGSTIVYRNTSHGNHTIDLNSTQIEAALASDGLTYADLSDKTVPLRFGLEDIEYTGETGSTDTIAVTDVSGSMAWESDSKETDGSSSSTSYIKLMEFNVTAPLAFMLHNETHWNSGTLANVTVVGDQLALSTGGPTVEVVDQQQTSINQYRTLYDQTKRAQSFTAGISGNLNAVELELYKYRWPPGFVVEIQGADGDLPNGTVLATSTRNDLVSWDRRRYNFTFSPPVELVAGRKYTFVTYVCCGGTGGNSWHYYRIYRTNYNSYSDGAYAYSSDFGSSWANYDYDLYFKTYMDGQGYVPEGNAVYEYDAGKVVDWFNMNASYETPGPTDVDFEFQASNDSVSWSGWETDIDDVGDSSHLRMRINMTSSSASNTPTLDRAAVFYDDPVSLMAPYSNYTFSRDEVRDFIYNRFFRVIIDDEDDFYLRIVGPSNQTYGTGFGTWQADDEVVHYTDGDDRIIDVDHMASENGTWEVWAARDSGGSRNYDIDVEYWDPTRMDVAQFANKLASQIILNNSNNQVGLATYYYRIRDTQSLTNNYNTLKSVIDNYYADGGTCICCGINRARQLLPSNGTRYMIVMSDGDANYRCTDYDDTVGSSSSLGPDSAVDSGQYACSQGIRVFTIGFGTGISAAGTQTLRDIACNESDYFAAQNAEELKEVFENISRQILGISYTKQSINISGVIEPSYLYTNSYIRLNYTSRVDPDDYGEIIVNYEGPRFNNTISNGTVFLPEDAEMLEVRASSYSENYWTSNVTIKAHNSTNTTQVFRLSDFGPSYSELGDPYLVNIPVDEIVRDVNNTVTVKTGITPGNHTNGSMDNRLFYTIVIKNYADSPQIGSLSRGCKWELEYEDGSTSYLKVPANYNGTKVCYYKNSTYDADDSADTAAYALFSQLDLNGNGQLSIKLDQNQLEADLITVENVPSLWGPSFMDVRVWK